MHTYTHKCCKQHAHTSLYRLRTRAHKKMSVQNTHTNISVVIPCHNAQSRYIHIHSQLALRNRSCKSVWSILAKHASMHTITNVDHKCKSQRSRSQRNKSQRSKSQEAGHQETMYKVAITVTLTVNFTKIV